MAKLSIIQRTRLAEFEGELDVLEQRIERDGRRWGEILIAIREEKLFLAFADHFEDYCEQRRGITARRARQLIDFAKTVQEIVEFRSAQKGNSGSASADTYSVPLLPENERQTRPLSGLDPEEKAEAWEEAVSSANGEQPTGSQVKAAVQAREIGDEPEEAVYTDPCWHEVPDEVRPAFDQGLTIFVECDGYLRSLQEAMDTLSRTPGGEQMRQWLSPHKSGEKVINKSRELQDLRGHLKLTRPHSVCPWCAGKKCSKCSDTGWVSKMTWDGIEDSVKARLKCS